MTRLVPSSGLPALRAPAPRGGWDAPRETASAADLWRILRRRRWLILATVLLLAAGAVVYGMMTPPLYTASAEVLIDPRDRQVVINDVNPSGVAPDGGVTQIESQARVFESSTVLLRAIAATGLTRDPEFAEPTALAQLMNRIRGRASEAQTPEMLEARVLGALKRRLAIKRADKVFVIEVEVTTRNAEKSAAIANAIADAYLSDQAQAKGQAGLRASDSLTARLDEQRDKVRALEDQIQKYREANNIVLANGQSVGGQQLSEVSSQLAQAVSQTAALRARLGRTSAGGTAEAMQSPVVAALREQESVLSQRLAQLQARFRPNNPMILSTQAELDNVQRSIAEELGRIQASVQTDYARALSNQRQLEAEVQRLTTQNAAADQASVKLNEMERDLEASRSVYQAFLLRAHETREQADIDTTNARVISEAIPPTEKSWPPTTLLLLGAIGSGLGLGCGLALVREYVGPTILSRGQVERVVGAPVISRLPLAALKAGRSAEGFEADASPQVLAGIGLALQRLFESDPDTTDLGAVPSVVVVSAPADDVARRAVCRLLSSVAALQDERVLLVDADLSSGKAAAEAGLFDVLKGDCSLGDAVDQAAGTGIAVLGRGRDAAASGRSAGARASARSEARRMLAEARGQFDLAVIDGGALSTNLRAAPLVAAADEVLLVVRLGRSAEAEVKAVADAAAIMGRPVSAILAIDPTAPS